MSNNQDQGDIEQDLQVGNKFRFNGYDCDVKSIAGDRAIVACEKLGEFPVPRRQPVSLINAPTKKDKHEDTRGPVNDRVDTQCQVCGATYLDCSRAKAQELHNKEQKCNGKVSLIPA